MIFVTVGTTQFDELVEAIDKIAPDLEDTVIVQAGNHEYVPQNCQYFSFTNNFSDFLGRADIVIAHGGAGITFETLNLQKRLISVENTNVIDRHQSDLIRKLSSEGYLVWCEDTNRLNDYIKEARRTEIKKYVRPHCKIGKVIIDYL